jgi:hypothetical protein
LFQQKDKDMEIPRDLTPDTKLDVHHVARDWHDRFAFGTAKVIRADEAHHRDANHDFANQISERRAP